MLVSIFETPSEDWVSPQSTAVGFAPSYVVACGAIGKRLLTLLKKNVEKFSFQSCRSAVFFPHQAYGFLDRNAT
jgi:hypothetical protein